MLNGRDVMAAAKADSGKTAAYALPMLQRLMGVRRRSSRTVRAFVVVPTRERDSQVARSVRAYGVHLPFRCPAVFSGVDMPLQLEALDQGVDIVLSRPVQGARGPAPRGPPSSSRWYEAMVSPPGSSGTLAASTQTAGSSRDL